MLCRQDERLRPTKLAENNTERPVACSKDDPLRVEENSFGTWPPLNHQAGREGRKLPQLELHHITGSPITSVGSKVVALAAHAHTSGRLPRDPGPARFKGFRPTPTVHATLPSLATPAAGCVPLTGQSTGLGSLRGCGAWLDRARGGGRGLTGRGGARMQSDAGLGGEEWG